MTFLDGIETPLDTIKSAFAQMRETSAAFTIRLPPVPVGPAVREMDLDGISGVISNRNADPVLRAAVWGQVIRKARRGEAGWMIVAAGLAHGKLVHKSILLAGNFGGDRAEDQADLIEAFIIAVRDIDILDPEVFDLGAACAWRAYAAVRKSRRRELANSAAWEELPVEVPASVPVGHPDILLARAVRAGVLTEREAEFIGRSYLEQTPTAQVAAWAGVSRRTFFRMRRAAEVKLAAALRDGTI